MWLSDSCDLNSVDEGTAEKAYKTIEEMKARLDIIFKKKANVK
jgi:hypothetical protein